MPRTKKPAGTAVDPRNGRRVTALDLAPKISLDLPRARDDYHPLALEAWDGYWAEDVAATVRHADRMIAWTWIDAYDDAIRKRAQADEQPLVTGSMGQQVANPLYQVAHQSMMLAMACAKQLGIGGRNRADLGIALFSAAAAGAADPIDPEGDEDDGDDDDPRLAGREDR
jgi:hypothetical protein